MAKQNSVTPGTIYLVSTPIGNLSDITLRALEFLENVDIIASEDTRKTGLLLKHFNIKKTQISFHEYNENRACEKIMNFVFQGKSVALVTDAGTPGISDPGFTLVRRAIEENTPVTMIPGPAAFVMSLVLSGLPSHSFTFRGFPPRKPGKRRRFIELDKDSPHTLIFYESPHRLKAFLKDALDVLGDRDAAVTKELTKKFEKVMRGAISELIAQLEDSELKGEYTVVIAGS
ncbi:MAG: 16S rRNA (cytidine(1402)-2'-O)-methyltransferase [Desulfobacterales bacterium]|nr:16S rRNA (cytidine(1402)-2'-O)-methyltransferase [Desulfobacterales bacterium]